MARTEITRRWLLAGLVAGLAASALAQALPGRGGGDSGSGSDRTARKRRPADPPAAPPRNLARQSNGRAEYVVSVAPARAAQVAATLAALGANLLRDWNLASLSRRVQVYDLGGGPTLAEARSALAGLGRIDLHQRYRFAGGPRLFAAALLGEAGGAPCRIAAGVRIGLIDGPVNHRHPALANAQIARHSVLRDDEAAPGPDHGTAIAGLMVGEDATGALAGFAQGAALVAVSAFSMAGGAEGADVERIGQATDLLLKAGVRLINLSFAGPPNEVLADLLAQALAKGAVLVAAVGNDSQDRDTLPAGLEGVIGVTAVDAARRRYARANTGSGVDFAAPGVDLFAAKGAKGGYVSGTSFAAPIVTAYAARLAAQGNTSATGLRRALAAGALDLGRAGPDAVFGLGLVQAPVCR